MSGYVFPEFAFTYVAAAILSFVTAALAWNRRANPGNVSFALMLMSLCVWSFASIFEAGAPNLSERLFWSKWQYIGIVALPPLWLFFAADFAQQNKLKEKFRVLIMVIPLITLGMAITNEHHHLLWSNVSILPGILHITKYEHGPWFYVHIAYSYLMLFLGTYWLIKSLLKFTRNKRRQIYIIFAGLLIGWSANVWYITGLFPIEGLDITPLSFTFIAFLLFWNIFQMRLFNIVPLARDILIDNMHDGVIVLDPNNIIVDINPAAAALIGVKKRDSLLGLTLREVLKDYSDIIDGLKGKTDYSTEIQVSDHPPRFLGVNVTTISDDQKKEIGEIVVIFDITKRKLAEIEQSEQRILAQALANTAADINSSLDLDDVLENILENVGSVVPHDAANIALVDVNKIVSFEKIKVYEKYGTEEDIKAIKFKLGEIPNFRRMAKTRKAAFCSDTRNDPNWATEMQGSAWIKSYIGAPIIAKDQLLGFISLDAERPNYFREEHISRLEAFANQAAVAIMNAQYFKEISESAQEMSILYEVGLAVTSGSGLDKTVVTLFNQLKRVLPIEVFFIAMLDDAEENAVYTMFEHDGKQIDFGPVSMKDRPSLTRYVVEQCKKVYLPDTHSPDSEFPRKDMLLIPGHDPRSILGIPLLLRNKVLGAMFVEESRPNAYNQDQIRLVETIANQATIVMDNARLFEQVQQMAITDSLTGVFNRRYFFSHSEKELARAVRYGSDLALIMLDIDHFKLINDHFGHVIGDQTLIMMAQACASQLRKMDILCRFGGEEFVVLLPETSQSKARVAAERIRKAISGQHLATEQGEVRITVSIGVAGLENKDESLTDLINKADKALYQAKGDGRNCVRVYKP